MAQWWLSTGNTSYQYGPRRCRMWVEFVVSSLLREVSLRVTRVFPYPKNVAIPNSISTRDQVDHEKILKKEITTILMGFFRSEVKRLGSRLFLVHLDWVE